MSLDRNLLLHEASTTDLFDEIARRCSAAIVIFEREPDKKNEVGMTTFIRRHGGFNTCLGMLNHGILQLEEERRGGVPAAVDHEEI